MTFTYWAVEKVITVTQTYMYTCVNFRCAFVGVHGCQNITALGSIKESYKRVKVECLAEK